MSIPRPPRWQPAHFQIFDTRILTWLLLATATIRGLDYGTGNDALRPPPPPGTPQSALIGIEGAFPLWVWSILLLTACAVLLAGLLLRWHFIVWLGHLLLCALYAGLLVGLLAGYIDRPYLDGVRSATGLALPVALHMLFLWRMGPRPVHPGRTDADPA